MAAPKTVHGARAKISLNNQVIGIWTSFDYSVAYDVAAVYILGRFSAAELVTTAIEPVNIDASGFRIVKNGFFKQGQLTQLKDLLNQEGIVVTVIDRQNPDLRLAVIKGCKPTSTTMSVSAKQLATGRNSYMGLLMDEEDFLNDEAADATDLP